MKLEDQVASLELCKRLKELGVNQESLFYWIKLIEGGDLDYDLINDLDFRNLLESTQQGNRCFSAFTVAELGEMLPRNYHSWRFQSDGFENGEWVCAYFSQPEFEASSEYWANEKTEADVRAKMLIHLIEKGIVKP